MRFGNIGAYVVRGIAMTVGIIAGVIGISSPVSAATSWSVGVSGGSEGINGFHLSVGEYYHVPTREVVVIHERGIHHEELPVVFFIAQRAHVSPEAVVKLRHRGMSWMDITLHFGMTPEIYYVPVRSGHPYGHAYGHYRGHPQREWRKIHLRDQEIVNQVNLKFISEHHRYAPEDVMRFRSEGRKFVDINRNIRNERHDRVSYKDRRDDNYRKGPKGNDRDWKERAHQSHDRDNNGGRNR